jgi:hypothetical protein
VAKFGVLRSTSGGWLKNEVWASGGVRGVRPVVQTRTAALTIWKMQPWAEQTL